MASPGAKPGQRFGGRPKGAPNKDKEDLRAKIALVCGDKWDPVQAMAFIAMFGQIPIYDMETKEIVGHEPVESRQRIKCMEESAQYTHAKRKAIEISQDPDNPFIGQVQLEFVSPPVTPEV
jgi:hypothetical protein